MKHAMKALLFALIVSIGGPKDAPAQAAEELLCVTADDFLGQGAKLGFPVLGQFSDITSPTGFHVDKLIIFEMPDKMWTLVWFDKDGPTGTLCFAGSQDVDEKGLDDVLMGVTRKAGPSI